MHEIMLLKLTVGVTGSPFAIDDKISATVYFESCNCPMRLAEVGILYILCKNVQKIVLSPLKLLKLCKSSLY